jgi:hypothetical protein
MPVFSTANRDLEIGLPREHARRMSCGTCAASMFLRASMRPLPDGTDGQTRVPSTSN